MHLLLLLVYLGIVILRKERTYSQHFKWKQHLLITVLSYQALTHDSQGTMDRSPEFFYKTSYI